MASQIAHIIYAQKYFDALETGKLEKKLSVEDKLNSPLGKLDRDEFLLGCIFPDIRRIDESIKRKDTHLKFEPLDLNFNHLNSFQAGWKFHLFCDMKREDILNKYNFYSLPGTVDFVSQPAKMLEDELFYDDYNNWEKLYNYFNHPPFINTGLNINQESFYLWYAIVAKYLEKKPDEKSIRIFLSKQPSVAPKIDGIIDLISKLKKNKKIIELLEKVREKIV